MQGLVELAVARSVEPHPHRLAAGGRDRGGPTQHGEGGVAAAAARIGPTPHRLSRSGRQARTRVVMACVWSAISASRSWMRRARARRLATVAAVSTSQVARWRNRPQVLTRRGVVKPRSRPRRGSGAATTSAWSWRWASPAAWTAERLAASRTDNTTRWPAERSWASWSRPKASRGARVASSGSDLAPWRRARLAGPAPPPARPGHGGSGSGPRHSHRCPRSPTPADRPAGRRAAAAAVAGRGGRHGRLLDDRAGGCQHGHRVDSLPGDDVDGSVRTGDTAGL
jgi:hypothetical protein